MKSSILTKFILEMLKIEENTNAISIAFKIKKALKNKKITDKECNFLMSDLKMYCDRYYIETSNEIFAYSKNIK
jgi:ABC-type uncharacterized transport system substrate-binding protein